MHLLSEKEKVATFQKKRKRGDVINVATGTGYSSSHTSNVLNKRRNNSTITSAAYRLVRRRVATA